MKLRIKGNSLRLRVGPSEVVRLLAERRVEDTIHFGAAPEARLTYALEISGSQPGVALRYQPQEVVVLLSEKTARRWADSDEITIADEAEVGDDVLAILVEKDFACIDRDDRENADTFPNPKAGAVC
jgi:hypothetical protein